jgi:hypothetical protein
MTQKTTLQGHETLEKIGTPIPRDGRTYTLVQQDTKIFYLLEKHGDPTHTQANLFLCDELCNGKPVYRYK